MLSPTELFAGLVALVVLVYYLNTNSKGHNFPPGPRGLPIFGHILFFGNNPAQKFLEWKKIYGPIFTVRLGSFQNSYYGQGAKQVEQTKFATKAIREFGADSREELIYEEVTKLFIGLKSKIREREGNVLNMNNLFRITVINSFWGIIMGKRFEENDPKLSYLLRCFDQATSTGNALTQLFWFFPWVAKLGNAVGYNPPLQGFQNIYKFMEEEIKQLKQVYVKGRVNNYTDAYFSKIEETIDPHSSFHESDNQQPFSTGDLFLGAVNVTALTLDWFCIYLARAPTVQARLQEELDSVLGLDKSRVPRLSDQSSMPYTNAVIEELLRVTSVAPLGFFRRTIVDVEFKSYKIPKDTMVVSNLYGIHRNPDVWQNPEKFDPQRFLDKAGKFRKTETNASLPFGFGRRICVAEVFARQEVFLLVTNFFREFSVSCTVNMPSLDTCFAGVALAPLPFELNVKVR